MEFDGAICHSGVKITGDMLEGNRRLKAIARAIYRGLLGLRPSTASSRLP